MLGTRASRSTGLVRTRESGLDDVDHSLRATQLPPPTDEPVARLHPLAVGRVAGQRLQTEHRAELGRVGHGAFLAPVRGDLATVLVEHK